MQVLGTAVGPVAHDGRLDPVGEGAEVVRLDLKDGLDRLAEQFRLAAIFVDDRLLHQEPEGPPGLAGEPFADDLQGLVVLLGADQALGAQGVILGLVAAPLVLFLASARAGRIGVDRGHVRPVGYWVRFDPVR